MSYLVIEADRVEHQYWRDLWRFRELFLFFTWRDLLVRYKQTVVGVSWSLIRPLLTMLILTFVFGKLGRMPSAGIPYPLLVFCGMVPWQFFSNALTESGYSLVGNAGMISKVYFPRLVMTVSSVITNLFDALISSLFLIALMFWYHFAPSLSFVFLPFFVILAFAATLGAGIWVAALTVEYRDFRIILPFVVQLGLYVSPVGFQSSVIPEKFRLLYAVNPMVGIIDGIRWSVLGGRSTLYWPAVAIAITEVAILLASGIWYFRKTELTFADVI
jgi:lipopolysaccharide transport system permease protein